MPIPAAEWDVARVISAAPLRSFEGTVWRVHWREAAATDWNLSLRTSGRYHRGLDLFPPDQVFPALYTSLAPEIALWEMVRRSAARNLAYLKNNILSELAVNLGDVLDLSDPASCGLIRADLTAGDFQLCQELAATALSRGLAGLVVPSAALPGLNLVLLPRNPSMSSQLRVVRSTALPLETIAHEQRQEQTDEHH